MEKITWQVELIHPPMSLRYCKKCGCNREFESTGRFRVNANRKLLDVWLIYHCSHCQTRWNLTVLTRINAGALAPGLLEQFHSNDPALALAHGLDPRLLRANGGIPTAAVYRVVGAAADPTVAVWIQLHCPYPTEIPLAPLLREKLGLSRKKFAALLEERQLYSLTGQDLASCKLQETMELYLLQRPPQSDPETT